MTNYRFKLKLLKDGVKQHICERCSNTVWESQPIPLEIHHIDGNSKNNDDLKNIQLLCPNCHALTPNYRGKNKIKVVKTFVTDEQLVDAIKNAYTTRHALILVGLKASGGNYGRVKSLLTSRSLEFMVRIRHDSQNQRLETIKRKYGSPTTFFTMKINWPTKDELVEMIKIQSIRAIAKNLGVSDNGVRKAAKRYGIDVRSLSKWSQKHGS